MISLIEQLQALNDISKSMLAELHQEEPSFDELSKTMDNRQKLIETLDDLTHPNHIDLFTKTEQQKIENLFQEFIRLNETIKSRLSTIFKDKKTALNSATKSRKAEEGYQILQKPNLSYL